MMMPPLLTQQRLTFSFDCPVDGLHANASLIKQLNPDFVVQSAASLSVPADLSPTRVIRIIPSPSITLTESLPFFENCAAQRIRFLLVDPSPLLATSAHRDAARTACSAFLDHAAKLFFIGITCDPEAQDLDQEIDSVRRYYQHGCSFLVARNVVNNTALYRFLCRLHRMGLHLPVIVSIMPLIHLSELTHIRASRFPPQLAMRIDRYRNHPAALRAAGLAYATSQIVDLVANDLHGIHIQTACSATLEAFADRLRYLIPALMPETRTVPASGCPNQ